MRTLTAAAAAAVLLTAAGCGSTAAPTATQEVTGIAGPALATSLNSSAGASWAIVEMGGSAATFNNFWELFVRPASGTGWKLATPLGVASNGGIVATRTGPGSLVTGFRPSQDLLYSPLAATADAGTQWTQNGLLSPGLADLPSALAAGPAGRLLGLTDAGGVELSTNLGAAWTRLTTEPAMARTTAGRACSLTQLTAAAWTPAGTPLLAGTCGRAGIAGIFALTAGSWRAVGPVLPGSLAHGPVNVIGVATEATHTTAVLAVGTGTATAIVTAWSASGGRSWTLSSELRTGASAAPSVSFFADGSVGVVWTSSRSTAGRRGATIGWQGAGWRVLPELPSHTATLAFSASGQPEALAASGGTLTAWSLGASGSDWTLLQIVHVTIPYGSSD